MIEDVIEPFVCIVNHNISCLKLFDNFYNVLSTYTSDLSQERKWFHLWWNVSEVIIHPRDTWQRNVLKLDINRNVVRNFAVVRSILIWLEKDDWWKELVNHFYNCRLDVVKLNDQTRFDAFLLTFSEIFAGFFESVPYEFLSFVGDDCVVVVIVGFDWNGHDAGKRKEVLFAALISCLTVVFDECSLTDTCMSRVDYFYPLTLFSHLPLIWFGDYFQAFFLFWAFVELFQGKLEEQLQFRVSNKTKLQFQAFWMFSLEALDFINNKLLFSSVQILEAENDILWV